MNDKGFIKLHRKILNNWIYGINESGQAEEPFDRTHAWIDLLLLANYDKTKKMYKGNLQVTNAGEIQTSIEALAYRWKWSRKKVARFLDMLESDSMIRQKRTTNGTTLTIEKWGIWQSQGTTKGTAEGTTEGTAEVTHKKKYKEIKESASTDLAKKPSVGAMRIGDIFTDSDGFQYIKKTDGTIDRYRGKRK